MKYWNGSTVFSIAFVLCMFLEHNNIRFFSKQLIKYIHISLSFFRWPGWLALLPHLWWPCHRPALRHHLLRRMQGVLQAEHLQQARLSLQPRQELRDVTQAAQPLPVLPPSQVSSDGHEPQRYIYMQTESNVHLNCFNLVGYTIMGQTRGPSVFAKVRFHLLRRILHNLHNSDLDILFLIYIYLFTERQLYTQPKANVWRAISYLL